MYFHAQLRRTVELQVDTVLVVQGLERLPHALVATVVTAAVRLVPATEQQAPSIMQVRAAAFSKYHCTAHDGGGMHLGTYQGWCSITMIQGVACRLMDARSATSLQHSWILVRSRTSGLWQHNDDGSR